VERADLDPDVHVLLLAGNGKGFCGGYDLVAYAEQRIPNHDPAEPWDPTLDHTYMSLFDGVARHTKEGYEFQALAMREGFRAAVHARDDKFGDWGR
jgi:hypothetical protein